DAERCPDLGTQNRPGNYSRKCAFLRPRLVKCRRDFRAVRFKLGEYVRLTAVRMQVVMSPLRVSNWMIAPTGISEPASCLMK
ncbi:MAG: hypothetical protein ACXWCW_32250, partial [Burkholderiales bacterium]